MAQHSHAGKPARLEDLTNIPRLMSAYYLNKPDMTKPDQPFGNRPGPDRPIRGHFVQDPPVILMGMADQHRCGTGQIQR